MAVMLDKSNTASPRNQDAAPQLTREMSHPGGAASTHVRKAIIDSKTGLLEIPGGHGVPLRLPRRHLLQGSR